MPDFTEDWFSQHIPTWEIVLKELKGKPIRAIELGSYEGRSSVWLLDNILTHHDSRLVCVDTWDGGEEHSDVDMKAVRARFKENIGGYTNVSVFKASTTEYLKYGKEADLIYIDASHRAGDVLTDAVLSHLLLKPGGIIIFDDYLWGGLVKAPNLPRAAIDAFMECYAEDYEVMHSGYQMILRKKNG
jgi:predicted O-methyltransferase YrrM